MGVNAGLVAIDFRSAPGLCILMWLLIIVAFCRARNERLTRCRIRFFVYLWWCWSGLGFNSPRKSSRWCFMLDTKQEARRKIIRKRKTIERQMRFNSRNRCDPDDFVSSSRASWDSRWIFLSANTERRKKINNSFCFFFFFLKDFGAFFRRFSLRSKFSMKSRETVLTSTRSRLGTHKRTQREQKWFKETNVDTWKIKKKNPKRL